MSTSYRAVFWDFGGVVTTSPFEAFARFERARGLPERALARINMTNPDSNAWARFERSEIGASEFDRAFAEEAAAMGWEIRGAEVLALLAGELRPQMIATIRRLKADNFKQVCITNNMQPSAGTAPGVGRTPAAAKAVGAVMALFDTVLESSILGVRKPDPRIYQMACEAASVAPTQAVFLDDLGVNLKPARALGMATIKVVDEDQARRDLAKVLKLDALP